MCMKIFLNDRVYVSNHDIKFLLKERYAMPLSVLLEIDDKFVEDYDKILESKMHNFMTFNCEAAEEYFKGLDFIIDYNDFKDKTIEELKFEQKIYEIHRKYTESTYPTLSGHNVRNADIELAKYGHIVYSIGEIINYREGTLKLDIPRKYSKDDIKRLNFVYNLFYNGSNNRPHEKIYRR